MRKIRLRGLSEYMKQSRQRRGWRKLVQVMACIVVFCTTYALILPAITMEKDPVCGLEEHTHSESCYEKAASETSETLACTYELLGVHVHTSDCYDSEKYLLCGQADYLVHEHNADCMGQNGTIVCQLPVVKEHEHTSDCCEAAESVHYHEDACYTTERGELTCQIAETEGHTHSASCYDTALTCELTEEEPHQHTDSCYELVSVLVCQLEEGASQDTTEPAQETEPEEQVRVCEKEVIKLHSHDDDKCYETYQDENGEEQKRLICEEIVVLEHIHSEGCFVTEIVEAEDADALTCTITEGHVHAEGCYDELDTLICQEAENHTHGEMCYGTWALICGKDEHAHTEECIASTEPAYACGAETQIHEENCCDTDGNMVCEVEEHTHTEECTASAEPAYACGGEEHTHDETCLDENGELVCGLEEHSHSVECTLPQELSEEDRTAVADVIRLIDALPTYDEIMAKLDEFYEADDTEDEEAYLTVVYGLVEEAYRAYMALDENLREYITNAGKLMELEFIWSRITLEEPVEYKPLPYAAENTIIHLFDYGRAINVHAAGQGFLPFYRIWPEYGYTVDGEASWDHDTTRPGYIDQYPPILEVKLGSNGYPVINRGADGSFGVKGVSTHVKAGTLQYLFDPEFNADAFWSKDLWLREVRKNVNFHSDYTQDANTLAPDLRRAYLPVTNNGEGTGLFQRDSEGYWYYNSALNAAWYNPTTQKFELYDYTVVPGHEHFEQGNGNFLPFNKGHTEGVIDYQTDETLIHSNGIVNLDHIVSERPAGVTKDNFRLKTTDRTNAVNVNFGMTVEFDFYMPKDGKINGKDMVFEFSGDDDVWVYIDGVLVLDIGGCHDAQFGSINFATGKVTYPGDTAGYYNNDTIKEMYDAAKVSTAGFKSNGTYTDYSVHTLKFFYMERGGNVSNCYLRFNIPQIEKNTINVTKALEPNQDVDLLGSPDYYFTVLELNSNNVTNKLFIGPASNGVSSVTGITTYKVKNPDGSYVLDDNGKVKVFSVEQYGIFSIKAGQTAVFEGIPANAGNFYVQEMIKAKDYDQYPSFAVNHGAPQWSGLIGWDNRTYYPGSGTIGPGGYTWYGVSGPTTNASASSSFVFEQQNRVNTSRLAQLSITKKLTSYNSASAGLCYKINVELDGEPLPAGTTYKVGSATRTVGFDASGNSYVELTGGETAVISNILSGTQFRVWESEESAKGHTVTYSVTAQGTEKDAAVTASGVTGTLRVYDHVQLTVTNTQHGVSLKIPVTKSFHSFAGGPYNYTFTLTEMFKDGSSWTTGETLQTKTETFTGNKTFNFNALAYLKHEFDSLPVTKYYMIEETGETSPAVDNTMQYLVEVTISERTGSEEIQAKITDILQRSSSGEAWKDLDAAKVEFVNTLTGSLTVTKTVKGGSLNVPTTGFEFTLTLVSGNSGTTPGSFLATKTDQNGAVTQETLTATTYTFTLKHGESITFTGLPIGTAWTVAETAPGFIQTWSVTGVTEAGASASASGNITIADTTASCINTVGYELPATGGAGTTTYAMAGLMLMLLSMAYLLYRFSKRRREAV